MALTGEQVLSMTPEQIAAMMTDDISVNNGLRSSHKPQKQEPIRYKPDRYLTEQIRAMQAELARSMYGTNIPTRVPILPRSAYRPPAKKPVITEHREQPKITSNLGKRKIKL